MLDISVEEAGRSEEAMCPPLIPMIGISDFGLALVQMQDDKREDVIAIQTSVNYFVHNCR